MNTNTRITTAKQAAEILENFPICDTSAKISALELLKTLTKRKTWTSLLFLPRLDILLTDYEKHESQLWAMQQPNGINWLRIQPYPHLRTTASLYLQLFDHLPDPRTAVIFQRALNFTDPQLKYFAAAGLLHQGQTIPASIYQSIAASAEMRNRLFDELKRLKQLDLFPKEFHTQAALAESTMVNWLSYTSLGSVPDEIELMGIVSKLGTVGKRMKDGLLDYYIFRFRMAEPHPEARKGWMSGMAGPFARHAPPSTLCYGSTFSDFQPGGTKSLEAQLYDIQKVMIDC